MQVHVARKSLPPFVDPGLLRLDDPRCGVVQTDENDIRLTTPLDRCGTIRRWNSARMQRSRVLSILLDIIYKTRCLCLKTKNFFFSSCIGFRTYDESVSFHNKVVAESDMGSKRSFLEFPFRCSYKKLPSSEVENYLQPLYYHGQGNGVNKWLERVKLNLARDIFLTIKRYLFSES